MRGALSAHSQTCPNETEPASSPRVNWQPYTLRFRQTFEQGYRYLDHCGEFMIAASRELKFFASEVKVSGAKLVIPEEGIQASVDAHSLDLRQEAPLKDFAAFSKVERRFRRACGEAFRPAARSVSDFGH